MEVGTDFPRTGTWRKIPIALYPETDLSEARFAQSGRSCQTLSEMSIRAVAFDFGHTLVDEQKDASVALETRPIHLMPDVSEILPQLQVPLVAWANTRTVTGRDLRHFLERAGIGRFFAWVVTSVEAGFRKPAPSSTLLCANAG
jgi:FMN phosphatase YigB (HAD superfamily)